MLTALNNTLQSILDALRAFMEQDRLTPQQNNIAVCFLSVVAFKLAQEFIAWLRVRFGVGVTYSKPALYMALSLGLLFWPLFDRSSWSWRLNTILPLAQLVQFIYKGAILKNPEDVDVQTLSLSSSPSELLFGPLQFAAVLVVLGLYRFQTAEAAVVTAAIGIGDAIAPVIGAWFGRHRYQMPLASQKTMEGSVCGVFMGSCSATYFFLFFLRIRPFLPLRLVLAYATIAAVVEGTCPGYTDNLAVPIAIHFSMESRVEQWLDNVSSYFGGGG